jgi:tight adherence protein C
MMLLPFVAFFVFVLLAVSAAGLVYQRYWAQEPVEAEGSGVPGAAGPESPWVRGLQNLGEMFGAFQKDDALRSLLFRAGYRTPAAVAMFHGTQIACGLVTALVLNWLVMFRAGGGGSMVLSALAGLGLGYLAPKRILEWQVRARAHRLRRALPPALDLMVLGLEAGQNIDQGVMEAARAIGRIFPDLSSELTFCSLEMRAGTPRAEALRRMGERCGEEEVRKLVTVLVDGERFGTSLGPSLRSHAHYLRTRMRHRAQEASRKLTVKLVMPVFFLIFPAVLLVTLGPAYLQLRTFLDGLLK